MSLSLTTCRMIHTEKNCCKYHSYKMIQSLTLNKNQRIAKNGKKDREFLLVSVLLNLLLEKVIIQDRIILDRPFNT